MMNQRVLNIEMKRLHVCLNKMRFKQSLSLCLLYIMRQIHIDLTAMIGVLQNNDFIELVPLIILYGKCT